MDINIGFWILAAALITFCILPMMFMGRRGRTKKHDDLKKPPRGNAGVL